MDTKILQFCNCFLKHNGRLGATYDVHLRLIGKRVVDFLLVFFFRYVLRLSRYDRISMKNRRFRSNWVSFYPKF